MPKSLNTFINKDSDYLTSLVIDNKRCLLNLVKCRLLLNDHKVPVRLFIHYSEILQIIKHSSEDLPSKDRKSIIVGFRIILKEYRRIRVCAKYVRRFNYGIVIDCTSQESFYRLTR